MSRQMPYTRASKTSRGLAEVVRSVGLARNGDTAVGAAACELVLESLVARKKISPIRHRPVRTAPCRSRGAGQARISSAADCRRERRMALRGCPSAAATLPISTRGRANGWDCFREECQVRPRPCAPRAGRRAQCAVTAHSWNRRRG